jgi:hypothetical protein
MCRTCGLGECFGGGLGAEDGRDFAEVENGGTLKKVSIGDLKERGSGNARSGRRVGFGCGEMWCPRGGAVGVRALWGEMRRVFVPSPPSSTALTSTRPSITIDTASTNQHSVKRINSRGSGKRVQHRQAVPVDSAIRTIQLVVIGRPLVLIQGVQLQDCHVPETLCLEWLVCNGHCKVCIIRGDDVLMFQGHTSHKTGANGVMR